MAGEDAFFVAYGGEVDAGVPAKIEREQGVEVLGLGEVEWGLGGGGEEGVEAGGGIWGVGHAVDLNETD
jgi:hypothetical protein